MSPTRSRDDREPNSWTWSILWAEGLLAVGCGAGEVLRAAACHDGCVAV